MFIFRNSFKKYSRLSTMLGSAIRRGTQIHANWLQFSKQEKEKKSTLKLWSPQQCNKFPFCIVCEFINKTHYWLREVDEIVQEMGLEIRVLATVSSAGLLTLPFLQHGCLITPAESHWNTWVSEGLWKTQTTGFPSICKTDIFLCGKGMCLKEL